MYNHLICCSDRNNTPATLGLLHMLEIENKLEHLIEFTCVGSGCILGIMLASGAHVREISPIALSTNIFETPNTTSANSASVASEMVIEMSKFLMRRFGKIPTLLELYQLTGKTIRFQVYNVTQDHLDFLSHRTTPLMSCITVCRFSFNIPYSDNTYSYCGNEYADATTIQPIPKLHQPSGSEPNALCICTLPDVRSIPSFHLNQTRKIDTLTGYILGRSEEVTNQQATQDLRLSSLAYHWKVKECVAALPVGVKCMVLRTTNPNTHTSIDQRREMLANWNEYLCD